MEYLEFLRRLHEVLEPPTYFEIGVRHGDSLALARGPAVGVDPAYKLRVPLPPGVKLFKETSDAYFERPRPLRPFGGRRIALAFIDGMHLVEFALRDFINVEAHAHWTSVVVFDDIFPRDAEEASRERETRAWTGDVYKILPIFARQRPDLICLRVDTEPTGLLLVLGLDARDRRLAERYDRIVARAVTPDPQHVPTEVVERQGALDPERVLAGSFWSVLRDARANKVRRPEGRPALRRAIQADLGRAVTARRLRDRLLARV